MNRVRREYQGRRRIDGPTITSRGALWVGISSEIGWGAMAGRLQDTPQRRVNGTSEHAYCSTHPGGMGALFCDGSVHFLSETIGREALEILAQQASGLPLPSGTF